MKAILVLDMPESCKDCSLMFKDEYSDWCPCKVKENTKDIYDYIANKTKPDWCPLREIPKKKEKRPADMDNGCPIGKIKDGWNACIDEMIGE